MHKNQKEIDQILTRYNLQHNLTARKVLEENFLSKFQIQAIKRNIISALRGDKIPSQNPLAVLVGGQSGAGKTALINYTQFHFNAREFVVIDNDLFRAFHPNVSKIRKYFPQFYTCCTEQLGANIIGDVISYFTGENETNSKYNIILHQTLSKSDVAINYLNGFNNLGYTTGLNVLAVPYIESKMSQIERCQQQYNRLGFCRYVDSRHHFNSVSWLLETVDIIENYNLSNFINVFARSEDISNPICVYTSVNAPSFSVQKSKSSTINPCLKILCSDTKENFLQESGVYIKIVQNKNGFSSAVDAIQKTREVKEQACLQTLEDRINNVINDGGLRIPGMQPHIEEVQNFLISSQNYPPTSIQEEISQ